LKRLRAENALVLKLKNIGGARREVHNWGSC
jgi:hypothetical protein